MGAHLKTSELQFVLFLLIGFVAFSLPLLAHDTRHLWGGRDFSGEHPDLDAPPGPPSWPWHPYDEDDPTAKFRRFIAEGNVAATEALYKEQLEADPPLDLVTAEHWHGNTPLFEAARSGHLELCRWLVSKGADADKANEWGDTAANEAGSMGHWDIVWFLNDKGANLSPRTEHNHNTLVLSAVRHQSTDALDELQRRGLDMNARSWNGASPLHEAARTGETKVVDWCAHARVTLSLHAHPPSLQHTLILFLLSLSLLSC